MYTLHIEGGGRQVLLIKYIQSTSFHSKKEICGGHCQVQNKEFVK